MNYFDYLQTLLIVFLLLGMMYGALYFIRKNLYGVGLKSNDRSKIKIISITPLMPKKFLAVVEINDKILILGITDHNITLLDKEEKFENDKEYSSQNLQQKKKESNFIDLLKKNLGLK
jgi:flagellar protein FliO/FliZ